MEQRRPTTDQTNYIARMRDEMQKMRRELLQYEPLGRVFLNGHFDRFASAENYTAWPDFDQFGTYQWKYYLGADDDMRYEHWRGFVYRANPITRRLERVPENPLYFVPDKWFDPKKHLNDSWTGIYETENNDASFEAQTFFEAVRKNNEPPANATAAVPAREIAKPETQPAVEEPTIEPEADVEMAEPEAKSSGAI